MNLLDMIEKVVEGNPGAMNALGNLMLAKKHVDPLCYGESAFPIINAIETGFTGSKLWGLFSDLCQKNVVDVYVCWRCLQLGIISKADLHDKVNSSRNGDPVYLENLRKKLTEKHPDILIVDYQHEYVVGAQALSVGIQQLASEMEEFDNKKAS